jgi:hypothetical protein
MVPQCHRFDWLLSLASEVLFVVVAGNAECWS